MPTLTETRIRAAKPAEKPYKVFDERRLFMLITHRVDGCGACSTNDVATLSRRAAGSISL